MERESETRDLPSPDDTETIDLTKVLGESIASLGGISPKDIGSTLFGKLLEALPIPALVVRSTGHTAFANRACGKLINEYKQLVGKSFADSFSDRKCSAKAVSLLETVLKTRKPLTHQAEVEIFGGKRVWGRVSLRSIKMGTDRVVLVLVEDLTSEKAQIKMERKLNQQLRLEISRREAIETALRESQEKLTLAIKGADISLWDWDITTDSLVCDDRLSEILGYKAGQIRERRRSWGELMPSEDSRFFEQSIQDLVAGISESFDIEHRLRTKSGDWRWVLTRGKIVARDERGKPIRALGTILDITEHKKNQERVRALTRALIRAQENERRNLALDLHDEIAQQISALGVLLEPVGRHLASSQPELGQQAAMVSRHIHQLVEQVRSMSYELRPPGLDRLGLVSAIGQYCRDFAGQNSIEVNFCPEGMEKLKLDFETEINLFRLVQEALTNVRKHAKAALVTIKLQALLPNILVSIEDNGIGFDVQHELEKSFSEKKMGLRSMEERVSLLSGMMSMDSNMNQGTRISIEVPWRGVTNECQKRGTDC